MSDIKYILLLLGSYIEVHIKYQNTSLNTREFLSIRDGVR